MTTMDEHGNIKCIAGDTFDLHLVDIKEDEIIIDWTDWKHELKVFKQSGGQTILSFDETDGIDTSIPGVLRFRKEHEDTDIQIGKYYFDWVITRPDGTIQTWINNKTFLVE